MSDQADFPRCLLIQDLIGHFLFSYLLMALPLLIAALVPEVFNIFAAAGGLFLMKVVLILDSVLERREKDG